MVAVLLKHGVLRTGKATMSLAGIDCGPTRSPISPLTADELAAVRAAYDSIGVLPVITTGHQPALP
jgi:dihydrodipicolinate synthase/N-acetylneuraminate lyase